MKVCIVTYDEYINIPYILKYEKCLKDNNISYDIILWDRRNVMEKDISENIHVFKNKIRKSKISKVIPFYRWRRFAINILKTNDYDKIIILTTLPGILIYNYLIGKYKGKYIFDIRDFTYENIYIYSKLVNNLISKSSITFISSEGFKDWLKPNEKIYLTHNISNIDKENKEVNLDSTQVVIGFVGGIRYYEENCKIINNLKNKSNVTLIYVGKTHAGINLKEYCEYVKAHNVIFESSYHNDEKPFIYERIDIINSVYGAGNPIVKTAIPNKLYDCILFKKPIMVSKDTYLAEVVEKYNLGFAVDIEKDDIYDKLMDYIRNFNIHHFISGCNSFKDKVINEENFVLDKINEFLG